MSDLSFREALGQAGVFIQEELTAIAVKQLHETSANVMAMLQEEYEQFFGALYIQVLLQTGSGYSREIPEILRVSDVPSWKPLSNDWMAQKKQSSNQDAFKFYIGLSDGVSKRMTQKHKRGRFRKGFRQKSLLNYVKSLNNPGTVQKFFGPGSITYDMKRPDGAKVMLSQSAIVSGAIYGISAVGKNPTTGRTGFLPAMDGTVLTAEISVFPKLTGLLPSGFQNGGARMEDVEDRITRYLGSVGDYNQWVKVFAVRRGEHWKIRPIVAPLIQWYLRVMFESILRDLK